MTKPDQITEYEYFITHDTDENGNTVYAVIHPNTDKPVGRFISVQQAEAFIVRQHQTAA